MDAMDKMDNREWVSALADGQLRGEAFARAVEATAGDAEARASWCAYHVVGEVLRTGRASPGTAPDDFLARLQLRLREEQAVSPHRLVQAAPVLRGEGRAANDWAWKLAAGVASVAAVAAVGWNLWGAGAPTAQPQLAQAPAAAPATAEPGAVPMIRDPNLDKLLAAHRQFGGASALGTSSGFLRNATFEAPSR